MKNKILYTLLFAWVRLHALLPLAVLYRVSDILYLLIYYVAHYRRKVTRNNLLKSFPDKPIDEIVSLEHRVYHHFADYLVETVKLAGISEKELLRRAHIKNPELIFDLMEAGHSCFVLAMGHYGNWDLFSGISSHFGGRVKIYGIYRPLKNKAFDRLFIYLRTRFHSFGIKKNDTIREFIRIKQSKEPSIVVFFADQSPSKANLHYWTTFLNQETAILTGPERIARKLDSPVIYGDVKRERRGYYTIEFQVITDRPKETSEYWITEKFARLMEGTILRDPAIWLWTHKRWKHPRIKN
jgi:KDO2-lipid IV(A) lauroyltransferase